MNKCAHRDLTHFRNRKIMYLFDFFSCKEQHIYVQGEEGITGCFKNNAGSLKTLSPHFFFLQTHTDTDKQTKTPCFHQKKNMET